MGIGSPYSNAGEVRVIVPRFSKEGSLRFPAVSSVTSLLPGKPGRYFEAQVSVAVVNSFPSLLSPRPRPTPRAAVTKRMTVQIPQLREVHFLVVEDTLSVYFPPIWRSSEDEGRQSPSSSNETDTLLTFPLSILTSSEERGRQSPSLFLCIAAASRLRPGDPNCGSPTEIILTEGRECSTPSRDSGSGRKESGESSFFVALSLRRFDRMVWAAMPLLSEGFQVPRGWWSCRP
mmetsp:Transcript_32172/g.96416  ORF Transcript_32172/g.96416 Transcript_32172/m.96416 type:complete len:232 (+) Transcript_32172:801-1496(+)